MKKTGKTFRRYRWLADGLLPLTAAVATGLWFAPWVNFLLAAVHQTRTARFSVLWIMVLVAVPAIAGRRLQRSAFMSPWMRMSLLGLVEAGLAAGFVTSAVMAAQRIGSPIGAVENITTLLTDGDEASWDLFSAASLVALALLLRGTWIAYTEEEPEQAWRWFQVGVGAFLALFIVIEMFSTVISSVDSTWLGLEVTAFLLIGLYQFALTQRQQLEQRVFRLSTGSADSSWAVVFGVVAVVILVGAGVSAAAITALRVPKDSTLATVESLARWAGFGWERLKDWVAGVIPRALGGQGAQGAEPSSVPAGPPRNPPIDLHWTWPGIPPVVAQVIDVALIAFVLLAAIWLASSFVRFGRASRETEEAEHSSLWTWQLFWSYLKMIKAALTGNLRRGDRFVKSGRTPDRREAPDTDSIRPLYRRLIAWCGTRARPRQRWQTAIEYEGAVAAATNPKLAARVTKAYVRARYGGYEPSALEVDEIAMEWREVRDAGAGAL
jgi:hypothetical protein